MTKSELRFGTYMLFGFIAFFFLMKALGLYTNINFRALNFLIHGAFVYLAMRQFRKEDPGKFSYLKVFGVGFRTSVVGVLGFAFFQLVYLSFLDPTFFTYIQENAIFGKLLTPFLTSFFLIMEGLGVAILTSYVGMRYLTIVENVPAVSSN